MLNFAWPGNHFSTVLLVFASLISLAKLQNYSSCAKSLVAVGQRRITIDLQCNSTSISMSLDGSRNEELPYPIYLEYVCRPPDMNSSNVSAAVDLGSVEYFEEVVNRSFLLDGSPLPDETVCSARGCFGRSFGYGTFLYDIKSNCTIDTDECEEGIHECGEYATCRNTIGNYTCECPEGYINIDNRTCEPPPPSPSPSPSLLSSSPPPTSATVQSSNIRSPEETASPSPPLSYSSSLGPSPYSTQGQSTPPSPSSPSSSSASEREGEERVKSLAAGLTLSLVIFPLLASVLILTMCLVCRRCHTQQRNKFRRYKFDVESLVDISYEPGVLKMDALLTVHQSVGSIIHELNIEHDVHYTSPIPVRKSETFTEDNDGDTENDERKSSDEISFSSSKTEDRVERVINTGSEGEDSNSSTLLSPTRIAPRRHLLSNDTNSSTGTTPTASPRQSTKSASGSCGYVREDGGGSSSGSTTTSDNVFSSVASDSSRPEEEEEEEEQERECSAVDNEQHKSKQEGRRETSSIRYVCELDEYIGTNVASVESQSGISLMARNHPGSNNTLHSTGQIPQPRVVAAMETNRKTLQKPNLYGQLAQQEHQKQQQQQQQRCQHHQEQQKQQHQRTQQQELRREVREKSTESCASLNIITDIDEAFPPTSSSNFGSMESLNKTDMGLDSYKNLHSEVSYNITSMGSETGTRTESGTASKDSAPNREYANIDKDDDSTSTVLTDIFPPTHGAAGAGAGRREEEEEEEGDKNELFSSRQFQGSARGFTNILFELKSNTFDDNYL